MGSCVSVHKDPESVMKLRFSIGSKNEKIMIPSPVKEKPVTVNAADRTAADVAVSSPRSPARYISVGSKDEAFFDSQPWMESDCEEDFFSVNGDLTPSRGNTPVHPNSSIGRLVINKLGVEEANGSPPDKKKRLSELFKESLRNNEYSDEEKSAADGNETPAATTLAQQLKSSNGTPYLSRANSGSGGSCEATPNGVLGAGEKPLRSPQCCLPKLLSSRSLNERKKKTASPARNVG
ncbi:hypothetical protein C2S53_004524 [Perilla frutescens var. hirtella]|uniref:Uncharacterized protein n=1 Tax=Perilla frutescens var. hirtella TaxID=608512 RepID=A0AAD4IZC9_PERFH|nr:hypothetical protein C2S53_004524 [Perilla frutescens var. hirtella]